MWKGPMKCPLVAHSSKWDRQAEQIYEMIRMERKGEGERKAHPDLRHCHLLPGPLQVASYCAINRTRTSPDMALCQSLNSSLADSTWLTSWYIDLAFTQTLSPTHIPVLPQIPRILLPASRPLYLLVSLPSVLLSRISRASFLSLINILHGSAQSILSWIYHLSLQPSSLGIPLCLCLFGTSQCQNKSHNSC